MRVGWGHGPQLGGETPSALTDVLSWQDSERQMTQNKRPMPGALRGVFGLVKFACILGGLPLTVLCLMAVVGAITGSGWIRLVAAVVVAIGLPLLLVDRLLPDDRDRARGLPSDVLALFYVGVPLLFAGAAHGLTLRMLAVEGDRLHGGGWGRTGDVAYWLASVEPAAPEERPKKDPGKAKIRDKARDKAGKPAVRADGGGPADGSVPRPDAKPAAPAKYTPAEIFRRCSPSVVNIKVNAGAGTGFAIDDKGTIATNSHVIHNATSVEVKLKDGEWVRKVELLVENEEADLALLRIDHAKLPPPLPLGDSDAATVGDQVVAIGNPLGLEHTLTDGLISARRIHRARKWLQISVPISPGNSGGPLIDMTGKVLGVTTAGFSAWSGAQNLNLAVPINELKKLIKDHYPDRKPVGSDNPQTW